MVIKDSNWYFQIQTLLQITVKRKPKLHPIYNMGLLLSYFLKGNLLYDVNNSPVTFKLDETTTSELKKQYDRYVQYWSRTYEEPVNGYCGSLFVAHCTNEQLIEC